MRLHDEPIGLRREQFGLVAAIALMVAVIPTMFTIAPPLHIVKMDIGRFAPTIGRQPLLVEITQVGEVKAAGIPVTLDTLSQLTRGKPVGRSVLLAPDACADYEIVIMTVAVLKRGKANFAFGDPNFDTSFGKAAYKPNRQMPSYREYVLPGSFNREFEGRRWQTHALNSIMFDENCQLKAYPQRLHAGTT